MDWIGLHSQWTVFGLILREYSLCAIAWGGAHITAINLNLIDSLNGVA